MEQFIAQLRQVPQVKNVLESARNEVLALIDKQIEQVASGEWAATQMDHLEALRQRVASYGNE